MIPKGSNSGIYVMGEYEIQILDSLGTVAAASGSLRGFPVRRNATFAKHTTVGQLDPRFRASPRWLTNAS